MAESSGTGVVYVPSVKAGQGSGHFRRALSFLAEYGTGSLIYIPKENKTINYKSILGNAAAAKDIDPARISTDPAVLDNAGLIIADLFRTDKALFDLLSGKAPLIAVDEGGPLRSVFPFLVDTLPNLEKESPNISDISFVLPRAVGKAQAAGTGKDESILVCFGGEDPADLGLQFVSAVQKIKTEEKFTIINASGKDIKENDTVKVLPAQKDLYSRMPGYKACIASFGLTAVEAAYAGLPCLLFNPTRYHARVAQKTGFACSAGTGVSEKQLLDFIRYPEKYRQTTMPALKPRSLSEYITESKPKGYARCPVCRTAGLTICRSEKRRYAECPQCGLVFMFSFGEKEEKYSEAYFDSEYKKQYGRTYLEDFEKIKMAGSSRAAVIRKHIKTAGRRLLDIGCAYGPFLQAASEAGFQAAGCDISSVAVDYVKKRLGFEAWQSACTDAMFGSGKWSAVTMWYVIEHLESLAPVLETAAERLEKGGIFAFSTPNLAGISGKKSRRAFLENGPRDHYTVWSPAAASATLKKYGFTVCSVRITGHHPERFPGCSRLKRGAGYTFLEKISKIAKLGDTFEIYARKK